MGVEHTDTPACPVAELDWIISPSRPVVRRAFSTDKIHTVFLAAQTALAVADARADLDLLVAEYMKRGVLPSEVPIYSKERFPDIHYSYYIPEELANLGSISSETLDLRTAEAGPFRIGDENRHFTEALREGDRIVQEREVPEALRDNKGVLRNVMEYETSTRFPGTRLLVRLYADEIGTASRIPGHIYPREVALKFSRELYTASFAPQFPAPANKK